MTLGAKSYALAAGRRYWPTAETILAALPVATIPLAPSASVVGVALPDWAADLGIGSPPALLVDEGCVTDGDGPQWRRCDWWSAAFLHLSGWIERAHEDSLGPIQSYAFRLGAAAALFDHAWVNRIFLFLRRWAARDAGRAETDLFGPLPRACLHLEHDVDYLAKTMPLRIKRLAFDGFNAGRRLLGGRPGAACAALGRAARVALTGGDYNRIAEMMDIEDRYGVRSTFLFHAGAGTAGGHSWLMDPTYRIDSDDMRRVFGALLDGGWQIGLHPGVGTWRDGAAIGREKESLERAAGIAVSHCRQHWLRFSWKDTWAAQQDCGLGSDGTLGFNDRPGFRNGAALRFHPWAGIGADRMTIAALPMVMMDSHFYDYRPMDARTREAQLCRWLDEIAQVGGEACAVWHQRVLHPDYGWKGGYEMLLAHAAARGLLGRDRP
jgi:hypothetical protein